MVTNSFSLRENVDRMADRDTEIIGLDLSTGQAITACQSVLQVRFPVKFSPWDRDRGVA